MPHYYNAIITLERRVIAGATKQQHLVAQSTTEAKYIGLAYALRDVLWIQNMVLELGLKAKVPKVFCDNQPTIAILKDAMSMGCLRHLDYKLQFEKDEYERETFILEYVESKDNTADIFTKNVDSGTFKRLALQFMKE